MCGMIIKVIYFC